MYRVIFPASFHTNIMTRDSLAKLHAFCCTQVLVGCKKTGAGRSDYDRLLYKGLTWALWIDQDQLCAQPAGQTGFCGPT